MRYPLLFTYRDTLFVPGFVVEVVTKGRVLGVEEPGDAFWIYGVNPGGLSAHGQDLHEAHNSFRQGFTLALHDIAKSVDSYDAFKAEVERFFDESNDYALDWTQAVGEVRAGLVDADIPRANADLPRSVQVSIKPSQTVSPRDNQPEMVLEALAA